MIPTMDNKQSLVKLIIASYLKYNPFFNAYINTSYKASLYRDYLHQMHLMARLTYQRPIRVLVADEIGLGKTVEAIRIIKHLSIVDKARKILIITPPILLDQWVEKDLKNFGIRPIILDKNNIEEFYERAKQGLINEGIFIGSMDRLKLSSSDDVGSTRYPYFEFINSVEWDLVIIDEAHKLSYIGTTPNLRYERLGSFICRNKARHCVLLTATPHRGKTEDFVARLVLLDKSFIPRPAELGRKIETLGLRTTLFQLITDVIFFRRIKEDVNKLEGIEVFKPAHQYPVLIFVPEEIKYLQLRILDFVTLGLDRYYIDPKLRGVRELLRKLIIKRAMSSEAALLNTFMRISAKRGGIAEEDLPRLTSKLQEYVSGEEFEVELDEDISKFVEAVSSFVDPIRRDKLQKEIAELIKEVKKIISEDRSPKVNALADIVWLALGQDVSRDLQEKFRDIIGGRIIVFTEFKDTAYQIYNSLQRIVEKRIGSIPVRYARKSDQLKREILSLTSSPNDAAKFVNVIPLPDGSFIGFALLTSESKKYLPVFQSMLDDQRFATVVLISTDVAAEGLNMQAANILVNYEVTWSPLKRDQRIGRIWRLGQKKNVYVFDFHMGTDFERSILENFTIKIITIAEQTGYTTLKYRGIAFYIPQAQPGEEEDYALRVVELERFSEGVILDNIASALQKAFTPTGTLDEKMLGEELSRLAIDIVRFTRQLKKELEALSRFRSTPEKVRKEVKLLLGFEDERDALEAANHMLSLLSNTGLAKIQKLGMTRVLYIEGQKINPYSLRDIVDAIHRVTNLNEEALEKLILNINRPSLVFIRDTKEDFKNAFLTFLVVEIKKPESTYSAILYLEPILIIETSEGYRFYRGTKLIRELNEMLKASEIGTVDDVALKAFMVKYADGARSLSQYLFELNSVLREKHIRFVRSKHLKELRIRSPDIVPDEFNPVIRILEKPIAILTLSPLASGMVSEETKESKVPLLEPLGTVSPEKKEKIKNISEALVKAYFENLGYKAVKKSEYLPYDLELYDTSGNLIAYIEVKGHETDSLVAELSQNEEEFAKKNKDKYIVCVVTNALTSPRITCKKYEELRRLKVYIEKTMKYLYGLGEE